MTITLHCSKKYLVRSVCLAWVVFGLISPLTASYAFTVDKEFFDLTVCRGQLDANTVYNLQVGLEDQQMVKENLRLYFMPPYMRFAELAENGISQEDATRYESVYASSFDSLTNSLNQETFGSDEYEMLLSCKTLFMKKLVEKRKMLDNQRFMSAVAKKREQVIRNLWTILGLEY